MTKTRKRKESTSRFSDRKRRKESEKKETFLYIYYAEIESVDSFIRYIEVIVYVKCFVRRMHVCPRACVRVRVRVRKKISRSRVYTIIYIDI